MDRDTIIDGLRMTMDLCVFDPSTGEEIEPHLLNDISRATYDACKGALEILKRLDTDSDTISRQAAIDALDEYFERIGKVKRRGLNKGEKAIRLDTVGAINSLPPAQPEQPEPKRGEWLERDVIDEPKGKHITQWQSARCSVCGRYHTTPYLYSFTHYNFCPNCGADMREVTT